VQRVGGGEEQASVEPHDRHAFQGFVLVHQLSARRTRSANRRTRSRRCGAHHRDSGSPAHSAGMDTAKPQATRRGWLRIAGRIALLIVGGLSLYLLAPKLIAVFASWPDLKTLKPGWIGLAVGFEALSYLSLWSMQRVALRATSWFTVGTAQLASGAVGSVVPGGAATAGAVGYGMLTKAGIRGDDVVSGLAATSIASTATILAMPVLALPAIIAGTAAPHGLVQAAYVGVAGFADRATPKAAPASNATTACATTDSTPKAA